LDPARRDGHRRRHQPVRGRPPRRRRLRCGGSGGRGDHPGAGRRRAYDDRLPAAQHAEGGADGGAVSRLRAGEWTAAIGATALLVTLFLDWFGPADESGWSSLGWVTLALCVAAIACGAWLAIANAV